MAEVAAAAIAAEQVVATGVEAAAAVAIAAPTLPLKISLTHLPNPAPEGSPHPALARAHHTLTVLPNNKAFIFGGRDPSGALCPPGIHTITLPPSKTTTDPSSANDDYGTAYTCYPPYSLQDASTGETLVPSPRAGHAACSRGGRYLLIHGGRGANGKAVDEGNCIWQWDCEGLSWGKLRGDSQLGVGMAPRWGHWMFGDEEQGFLVVVGGRTAETQSEEGGTEREVWMYDFERMVWTALPGMPAGPVAAAYAGGRVYIISRDGEGDVGLGGVVRYLDMRASPTEREKPRALVWESVSFPANPLAPGPKPREGGALVPLSTGHGREYLVYLFGCSEEEAGKEYYSDIWTLQVPAHGRSAAAAKDKIREKLPGMESGEFRWAEAEIVPTEQMTAEGKVHPGPRGLFAADACLDGQGIVLWGGVNAKGEEEGDGWVLRLAHGYADNDRYE
ncbi:hypothetical protein C8A01DRAFT_39806 [Parachaetomium inaequale]|uniref:Galactose oxidase n=1 Tax=Parachaetomium inaequale TaxID=2588326 RepID=A0AAN6SNK5_9PEZI|nr:hypothetical protein C8A01DRAFT_39806 [Parachaetomium inaequale]